jgi:hypothetical protein
MVTGAVIGAIGTVFAAIATILVTYFVKRTDTSAKMTRANMQDQQYVMQLVGAIRDDYWRLADSWYSLRGLAASMRNKLIERGETIEPLPEIPVPRHRDLEVRHARGEDTSNDER